MIQHLVFFKLIDGITDAQKQQVLNGLRALPTQISEIESSSCGLDFSGRSQGHEIGLVTQFADRAGLEVYATHPQHLEFIAKCKHLWTGVLALDFEV